MSEKKLNIPTARVFEPLLQPFRYAGIYGGRAGAKSQFAAGFTVEQSFMQRGTRVLCTREVQKALRESAKQLIEDKIEEFKAPGFRVLDDEIRTPGGGRIVFQGMNNQTSESIKSYEGFDLVWVEEAHNMSARSLQLLRPTIRKPGSKLIFTWNPHRKSDAVDALFRTPGIPPPDRSIVVKTNWSDNPFLPQEMKEEREYDLKYSPSYQHVWEGAYATVVAGAYFANHLAQAEQEGRITDLAYDPLLERKAYWDIGIDDAMTIWITQRIRQQLRFMDYIEGSGQPLGYYVNELRRRGHGEAECVLPHDGAHRNAVTGKKFSDHLKEANFRVRVRKGGGPGAAVIRVEAARRLFPRCWFNDAATQAGREALGAYHERVDANRQIGLGPEHDWCLARDTSVLTPVGWTNVQDLSVHDHVLTPCGPRRILRSGIVRMTDEWATVRGVKCTPEHRFFTSRGLIEAADCACFREKFWTRESLGLTILGFWSATLSLGFKDAITSATLGAEARNRDVPCSFIGWCTRLFMVKYRRVMKFITQMKIHLTTIQAISKLSPSLSTVASTSPSHDSLAYVAYAGRNSDATSNSARDAARSALRSTGRDLREKTELEPAYNLTVDRDECYFVRGDDGRAYLVSNSSHGSDSFGLAALDYEEPRATVRPAADRSYGASDDPAGWMA